MGHSRMTEGNWSTLEDLQKDDLHQGYATYRGIYTIVDLSQISQDYLTSISKKAKSNGENFPETYDDRKGRYLLLKHYGPYKGKDYNDCYFSTKEDIMNTLTTLTESKDDAIKSMIRKALKEDAEVRKTIRWNPDTQPNIYQMDLFLRKSGYRLVDVIDNKGVPEPIIESIQEGMSHPDIIYSVAEGKFFVRVKEYGEVPQQDLTEIIEGYQTAQSVVKRLESLDLNRLEYKEESHEQESTTPETSDNTQGESET